MHVLLQHTGCLGLETPSTNPILWGHVPQRWAKAARELVKIIRSSRSLENLGPLYQPPAVNKGT